MMESSFDNIANNDDDALLLSEMPAEMTPLERLLLVSRTVLQQAIDMLTENISSDEQLSFQSNYIPGSTIGLVALHASHVHVQTHRHN